MDGPNIQSVVDDGEHDQSRLEAAGADRVRDERRVLPDETQADVRVALAEVAREVGDQVPGRRAEHPEAQCPAAKLADAPHGVARAIDVGEDTLGLGAERASRLGQCDPASHPCEEVDPELALQLPDLLGERRLRDVERPRRRRERRVLRGREEVAQLHQIHSENL